MQVVLERQTSIRFERNVIVQTGIIVKFIQEEISEKLPVRFVENSCNSLSNAILVRVKESLTCYSVSNKKNDHD